MSVITPEVLLAQIKRERDARIAGDLSAAGAADELRISLQQSIDNIKATASLVRDVRDEFSAAVGNATVKIQQLEAAYISADAALVERSSTLEARLDGLAGDVASALASITSLSDVLASSTEAFARTEVTMRALVDANEASIRTEQILRADADSAIASSVTTLSATVGSLSASVIAESSARAAADGNLEGKYALKVVAGNVVTGMVITSASGPGTDVSDVIFNAANFKIYNGTSGIAPFQVSGGVVRITGSLVLSPSDVSGLGSLATLSSVDLATSQVTNKSLANLDGTANTKLAGIAAGADVTLAAINGGLTITSGGITLNGSPEIKSYNYVAGSSGWIIKGDGSVEFASGTFRGGVKIGTNSPTPGYGGDTSTGFVVEEGTYALFISRASVFGLSLNRNSSDGAVAVFAKGASQVGAIQVDSSSTYYVTTSDRRLKTKIKDADGYEGLVDRVGIREFEFKHNPGKSVVGVIAQELYDVYPAAVFRGKDTDAPDENLWSVDYSKLVPLLVMEVQALRRRVKKLERN